MREVFLGQTLIKAVSNKEEWMVSGEIYPKMKNGI